MEEFSLKLVEKLIDIAKSKKVYKLKVSCEEFKISIDLRSSVLASGVSSASVSSNVEHFFEEAPLEKEAVKGKIITSPIVGTFYDSPAPDKPPFVKVGDKVKKGDVLFIIESMKLMNEIKSEFDGVVSQILVTSGDGVEFEQPIIILE